MKTKTISLESCITKLVKLRKLLGPHYDIICNVIQKEIASNNSYWETITTDNNKKKFKCSHCGNITPVALKYCIKCGTCKIDSSGNLKRQ